MVIILKKTILITGAGTGLGKEASIALAKRGHKVYATVRYENEIEDLLKIAKMDKLDIEAFKLDILKKQDREKILNYDIDCLVCNAAIGDSGSVADIDANRFRDVFETNVFCNIETAQVALTKMINEKKRGRIIFLSSLAGRIPFAFLAPYCSSKFAIEGFTTCLRKEMKKLKIANIEIGVIEPRCICYWF